MKLHALNLGWHFVGSTLRDGRPIPPDGEWLEHDGPLVMCESGLHFCRDPFDALIYAPGPVLCRVEIGGTITEPKNDNKGICSRRRIIKRGDMTELLRYFARQQALSVVHLWKAPDVVLNFLMTGDEEIRAAAWAPAAAAWDARAAARAATGAADAAVAARAAAAAAWDAADATWDAGDAAGAAAAAGAARAARAARDAAADAQREFFNVLVNEAFE